MRRLCRVASHVRIAPDRMAAMNLRELISKRSHWSAAGSHAGAKAAAHCETINALHATKESFEIASQIAFPPMERPIPARRPWRKVLWPFGPLGDAESLPRLIVYIVPNLKSDVIAIVI